LLAVAGGAPSEYGEVQVWDMNLRQLVRSIKVTSDSLFGVSFSPDNTRIAVGAADKTVRAFDLRDGAEIMKCDNHIDWVFATAFTHDGGRVVSASRDRALKLIDVHTGVLIDDVNKPRDPILSMARHPTDDVVASGDEKGAIRLHRMAPRAGRLKEGDDKEESFVRELERLDGGAVQAIAFSSDGRVLAAATTGGEAKTFESATGKRVTTIKQNGVFAIGLNPDGSRIATGGSDGRVHVFDAATGKPLVTFDAVPVAPALTNR
jgi:WD40 repeat protein